MLKVLVFTFPSNSILKLTHSSHFQRLFRPFQPFQGFSTFLGSACQFTFAVFVVCLFALYGSLRFYIEPQNNGILGEILAPIGLILAFSYVSYVLIEFVRALLLAFTKLKSYLFSSSVQENYSATKKIIEGITAFIVAVTAMGASISAFIASINALLN